MFAFLSKPWLSFKMSGADAPLPAALPAKASAKAGAKAGALIVAPVSTTEKVATYANKASVPVMVAGGVLGLVGALGKHAGLKQKRGTQAMSVGAALVVGGLASKFGSTYVIKKSQSV